MWKWLANLARKNIWVEGRAIRHRTMKRNYENMRDNERQETIERKVRKCVPSPRGRWKRCKKRYIIGVPWREERGNLAGSQLSFSAGIKGKMYNYEEHGWKIEGRAPSPRKEEGKMKKICKNWAQGPYLLDWSIRSWVKSFQISQNGFTHSVTQRFDSGRSWMMNQSERCPYIKII